ncbi:MAG: bacterioferritin [Alphaproteobacteria bacterium]|nr:bacterioferritin [Alphaproteobacteria bacterium]
MQGDKTVIRHLNSVLTNELTAINQYFLHSRMFRDWGYGSLADKEHAGSIDEMKHADELMQRILFLEGLPNVQDLHKVRIGEDPVECLECDLALEREAIPALRDAIEHAESVQDFVSRNVLRGILDSEEEHVDWLETQLGLVKAVGRENWLQSQI